MAPVGLWLGVLALAGLAAAALLARDGRERAAAMSLALLLAALLVAADNWDTARFGELRSNPGALVAALAALGVLVAALATAFVRYPWAFALVAIAALPFRVSIDVGGETSNLLVPLYVVLAAGVAAAAYRAGRSRVHESGPSGLVLWARRGFAAVIVLYAIQAGYSDDFSSALEVMSFFLAPFAILFVLLSSLRWSPQLVRAALAILVAEGIAFALIGFGQYATRELFWNDKVIAGNEVHSWFRVNSLFWDPNIFGRYLAVTIIGLTAVVAWARRTQTALLAAGVALVLLLALALTFSQSSMVALIAGLAVVAALRWSVGWTATAVAGLALIAVVAVLSGASGTDFGSDSIEAETSGRAGLISGGIDLAEEQPIVGHGSGGFEDTFRERFGGGQGVSVVSHTEPITVAAEQGVIGLIVYVGFLAAASAALLEGVGRLVPGLGGPRKADAVGLGAPDWVQAGAWTLGGARTAAIAAFAAMAVHSLAYAAFFTDPITWVVIAVGLALAGERATATATAPEPLPPKPARAQASG